MGSKTLRRLFFVLSVFIFIVTGASVAVGKRPPWVKPYDPPVSAPEPSALSLIGVAAIGVVGYAIGKRKRISGPGIRAPEGNADPPEPPLHGFIPESQADEDGRRT